MKYSFILLPVCGAIFCFALALILKLRTQRGLHGERRRDLFDEISEKLRFHLKQYGNSLAFHTYLAIGLFGFVGFVLVLMMSGQPIEISLAGGFAGLFIPEAVLRLNSGRKQKQFENRYAQALQQMAASLRSGLTIQQSVSDLCQSPFIHESIKESFRQIDSDLQVGISVKEAFMRAAQTLGNEDAMDVALSLALQNELGGSEAKVVETVARNISNRILLRREIKSLFADTRITILTMDILPLIIIFGLVMGSPQYIEIFFQTPAMTAVFIGIILFTLVGSVVIRKTVKRGTGGQ